MSGEDTELTWDDGAPEQKPTVDEDGAWGGDWKNYYDSVVGEGSRNNSFDSTNQASHWVSSPNTPEEPESGANATSSLHQRASSYLPSDGNNTYTNSQGHTVGSDVRVSGRDNDGNILYNGRPQNTATGMNMLQSAAAPVTLGINAVQNFNKIDSLTDWDDISGLVTGLAGDVAAVGGMVKEYNSFVEKITDPKFDPVQWLAGTLIDFLIQAFQPLEDLVGLVSGNETRMKDAASMWNTVSEGATQVGDHIKEKGTEAIADWVGQDGDAARTRVEELGESVRTMGFMAVCMEGLLMQVADVAKLLRQDVVDLIAKGVSWMLTRLLPQAAAAVATFGAWTAGMIAQGIAKVASLVLKAINSINRVLGISMRAADVVNKVLQAIQKIKPVLDFLSKYKHGLNTVAGLGEQAVT